MRHRPSQKTIHALKKRLESHWYSNLYLLLAAYALVLLLWALPDWQAWAAAEAAQRDDDDIVKWRAAARPSVTDWQRILLAAAPLCPFRTGRQPHRDDRVDWEE